MLVTLAESTGSDKRVETCGSPPAGSSNVRVFGSVARSKAQAAAAISLFWRCGARAEHVYAGGVAPQTLGDLVERLRGWLLLLQNGLTGTFAIGCWRGAAVMSRWHASVSFTSAE